MTKGSRRLVGAAAVLASWAAAVSSPQASAETFPLFSDVTVVPVTVATPDQTVTVSGPGFPGQQGCAIGRILVVPLGGSLADASLLLGPVNLDVPEWSFLRTTASDGPLASGSFDVVLSCVDDAGTSQVYSTGQVLTVTTSATTTTTTTTTTTPPTTAPPAAIAPLVTSSSANIVASVEPTTAKPGFTTLTIRGSGFKVGALLQISLNSTPVTLIGTTTALATSEYAATVILPVAAPPGTHQLVVTGLGADGASRSTTATIVVGDLNCADFANPQAAQAALGPNGSDPHGLDPDRDGVACGRAARGQASASGSRGASANLPNTGTNRAAVGLVAGLAALTLGSLLMGLSHPVVPTGAQHRRYRPRR